MLSFVISFGALMFVVFCGLAWLEIYKDRVKFQRRLAAINTKGNQ